MGATPPCNGTISQSDLVMKTIEVVAAVLWHNESYLATQRGYGEFEGQCEFPGGKIEPGESLERHLNVRYKKS